MIEALYSSVLDTFNCRYDILVGRRDVRIYFRMMATAVGAMAQREGWVCSSR